MASKKKSKPAPKRAAKAKSAKKPAKAPARKAAAKKAAPRAPPKALQVFSKQVLREEEAPVAVRSFNEARAGIDASKEYLPKTGETSSTPGAPAKSAAPKPFMEPLSGPAAVPKPKQDIEFVIEERKKGKQPSVPSREDFGKIELRQQRGSRDAPIAHASPDFLQRSANRAIEEGKVSGSDLERARSKSKREEFKVAASKDEEDAELTDFGKVEIAQQTRRGRRTVGTLDRDEEE